MIHAPPHMKFRTKNALRVKRPCGDTENAIIPRSAAMGADPIRMAALRGIVGVRQRPIARSPAPPNTRIKLSKLPAIKPVVRTVPIPIMAPPAIERRPKLPIHPKESLYRAYTDDTKH